MKFITEGKKFCNYCKKNPGTKSDKPHIWLGFYDKDTDQFVCWNCRDRHYKRKARTKFRFRYTEFPVIIKKEGSKRD